MFNWDMAFRSRERLYHEHGLETLNDRRWSRKS